jgi:hypothetical protein
VAHGSREKQKCAAVNRSISLPIETEKKLIVGPLSIVFGSLFDAPSGRVSKVLPAYRFFQKPSSPLRSSAAAGPRTQHDTFRREPRCREKKLSFCFNRLPESLPEGEIGLPNCCKHVLHADTVNATQQTEYKIDELIFVLFTSPSFVSAIGARIPVCSYGNNLV